MIYLIERFLLITIAVMICALIAMALIMVFIQSKVVFCVIAFILFVVHCASTAKSNNQ